MYELFILYTFSPLYIRDVQYIKTRQVFVQSIRSIKKNMKKDKQSDLRELLRPALEMVREAMQEANDKELKEIERKIWKESLEYFNKHGIPYEGFPAMSYIGNKDV